MHPIAQPSTVGEREHDRRTNVLGVVRVGVAVRLAEAPGLLGARVEDVLALLEGAYVRALASAELEAASARCLSSAKLITNVVTEAQNEVYILYRMMSYDPTAMKENKLVIETQRRPFLSRYLSTVARRVRSSDSLFATMARTLSASLRQRASRAVHVAAHSPLCSVSAAALSAFSESKIVLRKRSWSCSLRSENCSHGRISTSSRRQRQSTERTSKRICPRQLCERQRRP